MAVTSNKRTTPSVRIDLAYGFLSLGGTTIWGVLGAWLLYFYLPPKGEGTVLVPAVLYSVAVFSIRVFSAAITPSIGYLSDKTRSRWGRRLPFMFVSGLPMLVLFIMVWTPPVQALSIWNLVYLIIVMGLYNLAYVVNQVPYMALLPEIARTDHHRVRVSVWASALSVIGMILAGAAGPLIENVGYMKAALIYACALLPAFYIPFLVLRERKGVQYKVTERLYFRQNLVTMMGNQAFRIMTATGLFFWGITTLVQATLPYIVTEICLLSETDTLLFYVPAILISMVCYPLLTKLTDRWGKWKVFAGSLLSSAIVLPGVMFIGDWLPLSLKAQGIIWVALQSVTLSGVIVLPRAFGAEIVDHDEELTGLRREGIYYATWGLLDQIVDAVMAALLPLLLLLGRSRYDSNGPLGVRMVGVLAGFLLLIGFFIFLRYPFREHKPKSGEQL